MKLTLKRQKSTLKATLGELYIDDVFQCYTLEDVVRKVKVQDKTAIPFGTYEVIINYSKRFKRMMPLLLNVPNFAGVRIHSGNTAEDTEGCILVGKKFSIDKVLDSRAAYSDLFKKMSAAKSKILIEIKE